MNKLVLVSLSTETEKVVKKEFSFPVVQTTPIIKEKTIKGVKTPYVSSGSLWLNQKTIEVLKLAKDSTVTISEAETGLFFYNSSLLGVSEQIKKKLTRTNILRLSKKNMTRLYADNALNTSESWYFKLEPVLADLPGEDNAIVYEFVKLEKKE